MRALNHTHSAYYPLELDKAFSVRGKDGWFDGYISNGVWIVTVFIGERGKIEIPETVDFLSAA